MGTISKNQNDPDKSPKLNAKETKELQERVGILRYISDMVFTHLQVPVSKIASTMAQPTKQALEKAKRIFGYLAINKDRALRFKKSDMIIRAHSDASYQSETNARSRSGGYIYMGNKDDNTHNGPILVLSKIQDNNGTCTAEAEYIAAFQTAQQILYIRRLAERMVFPQETTILEVDNKAAHGLANKINQGKKLRHIATRYHWLQDQIRLRNINVIWKSGKTNFADYATKLLNRKIDYETGKNIYTIHKAQKLET